MTCPLDATTGFQIVKGNFDQLIIDSIAVKQAPFILSFAPRQSPPSLINHRVDESTDNIILMKGNKYRLMDVQICSPTHREGIKGPTAFQMPQLDLVLTLFCSNPSFSTAPKVLLVIFPIYESNQESRAGYLRQLIHTEEPAASLQTLFYDKDEKDVKATSYEYNMCVDLVNPDDFGKKLSLNTTVTYFPVGCTLNSQDLQFLKKDTTDYRLPPALLDGYATVITYDVVDGVKSVATMSREGFIPTKLIAATYDEFGKIVQYNLKPPALSSNFDKNSCPYYKTTQYKCVPFSQMSVSGDYVVPKDAATLDKILKERDELNASGLGVPGFTMGTILGIAGSVITAIIAIGAFVFFILWSNAPDPGEIAIRRQALEQARAALGEEESFARVSLVQGF